MTTKLLTDHCPLGGKVVDIGAWPGGLVACLHRMGWQTIAVDKDIKRPISWTRAQILNENLVEEKSINNRFSFGEFCKIEHIEAINLNIETSAIPLESNSLDAVIFTEVIEHLWHDPLFTLSEINRILKQETGVLVLSTPNLISLRNRLNFFLGNISQVIENPFVSYLKQRRLGHLGHVRLYAPQELVTMLSLFGFQLQISFDQFEELSYSNDISSSVDDQDDNTASENSSRRESGYALQAYKKYLKKFFRSPKSYCAAFYATGLDLLEKQFPHFRPQVFVVGRKINDADFEKNYSNEVKDIVMNNSLE
jgi:SAM-dependent methyltransferase